LQGINATQQGRRAAANLLAGFGKGEPFFGSDYFWSDQYGVRVQFAGRADADEVRVVHGSPAEFRFLACWAARSSVTRLHDTKLTSYIMNSVLS
jgi:NAD/ferredoxin-dependent reductase-like protein